MPTTVPHPGVAGTSLQGRMEAAAKGGWRGNTQAGAEWRGRGIIYSSRSRDGSSSCYLPCAACILANPTLLQPFSLLKSWLSQTGVQAGGKPKGGAYVPARQHPGARMLSAPTSHLLHIHPSLCLCISDSRGLGAHFHGLCRRWGTEEDLVGPYKLACAEQNCVYLCSSCLCFLPAGAAAFQTPGQAECPVSRKRCEGCA